MFEYEIGLGSFGNAVIVVPTGTRKYKLRNTSGSGSESRSGNVLQCCLPGAVQRSIVIAVAGSSGCVARRQRRWSTTINSTGGTRKMENSGGALLWRNRRLWVDCRADGTRRADDRFRQGFRAGIF